jgi:Kef-type K+ transport system membrane component KefB
MAITAFPVLARVLQETGLTHTRVGVLTITCAAVDDVTAWCILAAITGIVRAQYNHLGLWEMLAGLVVYFVVMLLVFRPIVRRLAAGREGAGGDGASDKILAVILLTMLASSWATEWLGIHALFGAFFAGVIIPKTAGFAEDLRKKLRPLVVVFLLPLFFAFTGLRTSIGLIIGPSMLIYCVLIFLVAVAGKFGGSMVAARIMGTPWREAAGIGILMNTRGLMELVILNIGMDIGVLTLPLFSMMVVMAVGTTLMTTPLLLWVYPEAKTQTLPLRPEHMSYQNLGTPQSGD